MHPLSQRARFATPLLWILLLVPLTLEIAGFRAAHLFEQSVWLPQGWFRFEQYSIVFAILAILFGVWFRRYFVPMVFAGVLACSIWAVGTVPVGAVLLFLFSATILGRLIFGRSLEGRLAFMAGLAVWISLINLTARLPIHYPAAYLSALVLIVAIGYRHSRQLAKEWLGAFKPGHRYSLPEFVALALLAYVAVAHWLIVLKPEVSADGLAMHLAIATNMAQHHAFTVDFRHFLWAAMPLGADWCYSVLYMLGGEYAARLLNLAVMATIGLLVFHAARQFVSRSVAALMTALFLSTPIVQLITGSMFVENFIAAMVLAGVVAMWKLHESPTNRHLFLTAVLLGTAAALKLSAAVVVLFAVSLLVIVIWQMRRQLHGNAVLSCACAGLIFVVLAAIPYAAAWRRTGSPVFPLANGIFHSPYLADENLIDARYTQTLAWNSPWQLTFQTHDYYEAQDGSFGFQYLLLLPLALGCLLFTQGVAGRAALMVGCGGGMLIGETQLNARYLFPVLPLLTIGIIAALGWLQTEHNRLFRGCIVAASAAALCNVYFLPASGWYHKEFFASPMFSEQGRQSYMRAYAPVRFVVEWLNRVDTTHPVAYIDSGEIAGLSAPAYVDEWRDYAFWKQVQRCAGPRDASRLFASLGIRHLVVNRDARARRVSVNALLTACGQPEYTVDGFSSVTLRPDCEAALGKPAGALPSGIWDDADPRIAFDGDWMLDRGFPSTWDRTLTYSNGPQSQIRFAVDGAGFQYVYTKAFNRGKAEVVVDGVPKAVVDLFDPGIQWQARTVIAGLTPGRHDVAIRVLREKSAGATDYFVDLDAVEVF